jgi:hypothetical protein
MQDVEVLAVEVKQFLGEQRKALVSRVIGAGGKPRKLIPRRVPLTLADFIAGGPPLAEFSREAVKRAEAKGHNVKWNPTNFVLRIRLQSGRLQSYLYCYLTGRVDFYALASLPLSDSEAEGLRQSVLGLGVFEEAGEKTLTAWVEETNLPELLQALEHILDRMDEIARSH